MHETRPVLLDVTRTLFRLLKGKRPTGVDRVGLAYVAHFAGAAVSDSARAVLAWQGRVRVLSPAASKRLFAALLDEQPLRFGRGFWLRFLARLWLSLPPSRAERSSWAGALLFNTGHKGLESDAYAYALRALQLRPIYFVHDLIPLTHAEYCRDGEEALHFARMNRVLRDAAGVVVNSDFTRDALLHFAQTLNLPQPPICTAWLASGLLPVPNARADLTTDSAVLNASTDAPTDMPTDAPSNALSNAPSNALFNGLLPFAPQPYFVMLSTIEGRKNHLLVLHVWREWAHQCAQAGTQVPKLVLIGQRGWECEQVVDLLERSQPLRACVLELNQCSDVQLSLILQQARALLFPSFVEGFGMPLVEALGAGVPVIASDIPVFVEIAQAIPELLNPLDGPAWLRCVQAYAHPNSPERAAQIQRLQSYVPWTWAQHFERVEAFLAHELEARV